MTVHQALRLVALLTVALTLLPGSKPSRGLDVAQAADRALFLLEVTEGAQLQVEVRRENGAAQTLFELDALPAGQSVVEARVVPWSVEGGSDAVLIVMVLEREGGHAYRFLLNPFATDDAPFLLSEPLFESEGEPWRIVEARATGSTADGLEVTFRRGRITEKGVSADFEERVYVDSCTPAGVAGSKLFDVRSGELIR